ncbi:hypothetical protein D2E22_1347 [Bifidobacterium castoris]|uniref:Uncharacterized protein n=1 Tax=Bifidobacterium castoris TaxID=2306972 RepID=A0A430F6D5_9BIFI|nr:hypothetical protein D2E22_1347 [Bifidobacterium castoris]
MLHSPASKAGLFSFNLISRAGNVFTHLQLVDA